ncbi:sel1 repeat family protein [Rhodoligotrophos defluvii]|uniref:sel1 repeat family protein n=1 Tax=Rhodoligotrophos defluvii TaxID=2561934 RepID=UPI0010C9EC6F|nr:sel1 repeat family protein [Rhodoligotrophos defluvii]
MAHLTLVVSNERPEHPQRHSGELLLRLGLMAQAAGGERDLVAAHKWMILAALQGNVEARSHRRQLARHLTPEQIAEAHRQARAWLERH